MCPGLRGWVSQLMFKKSIVRISLSQSVINVSCQKWNITPILLSPYVTSFEDRAYVNLWSHSLMLAHPGSLSRNMPYSHCLSWCDCSSSKCDHATNFKRMNNHFVKVLPFKMAGIKPPIPVLKKNIYLLEGFPRNTSQQLETDSEVLVCTYTWVCLVGYTAVLQSSCLMTCQSCKFAGGNTLADIYV